MLSRSVTGCSARREFDIFRSLSDGGPSIDGTLGDRFVVRSLVARAFLCVLASGCTRTDVTAGPTTPTPTPTPTRIPRTFATKHFSISLTDVNQWVPMASGDRAGAVWGE
jgi:hypothetical protein